MEKLDGLARCPMPHPALKEQAAMECSVQEYREWLLSVVGFFPNAPWINDYWLMQKYSVKSNQILIAKKLGLKIPETAITNDSSVIKSMAERHKEIIVKPLVYSGFARNGSQFGCFTNILSANEIRNLSNEQLSYAPAIFQQRITKFQELRITIIGDEVFACEIKTKDGTEENIDWRIESVEELPHEMVEIPLDIADQLRKLLKMMGLNFGAIDMIKDDVGDYYFIEINPNGQYFWMELLTGAPMTEAMVSLILKLSNGVK